MEDYIEYFEENFALMMFEEYHSKNKILLNIKNEDKERSQMDDSISIVKKTKETV